MEFIIRSARVIFFSIPVDESTRLAASADSARSTAYFAAAAAAAASFTAASAGLGEAAAAETAGVALTALPSLPPLVEASAGPLLAGEFDAEEEDDDDGDENVATVALGVLALSESALSMTGASEDFDEVENDVDIDREGALLLADESLPVLTVPAEVPSVSLDFAISLPLVLLLEVFAITAAAAAAAADAAVAAISASVAAVSAAASTFPPPVAPELPTVELDRAMVPAA